MTVDDPASVKVRRRSTSSPRRSSDKQERAYQMLRGRILAGTYGPGDRLVIDRLARELRVSPPPVREAVRRLEAEGWVVYERNQGARVAPVNGDLWGECMSTLAILEGYAARLSVSLLTAADHEELRAANEEMRDAMSSVDIAGATAANVRFHRLLYERCPNRYLVRQIELTLDRLSTVRTTILPMIAERLVGSIAEHDTIITMLEEGRDPADVEALVREHKLRTVGAYEQTWSRHRKLLAG